MLSLASVALFSQLTLQQPLDEKPNNPDGCSFSQVEFTTDFSAGRLHHCEQEQDGEFKLY